MKTERSILCGKRIREIRNYLGLTQEQFGDELGRWGIKDRSGNPGRSADIVASWESGRNQVQTDVIRAIIDNVSYYGLPIQFSYLSGESDYITQSPQAIIKYSSDLLNSNIQWEELSKESLQELLDSPLEVFASKYMEEILPIFGKSSCDFFDSGRFIRMIFEINQKAISKYIDFESKGE